MSRDATEQPGDGAGATRPKGAARRKRVAGRVTEANPRKSLNLSLDLETIQRLNVHAIMTGQTVSQLVRDFALTLKEFSVHRHAGKGGGGKEQGEAA